MHTKNSQIPTCTHTPTHPPTRTHARSYTHTPAQQYTVVQKQVQVPVVTKTVSYQQPIVQAAPVKPVQYEIPVYEIPLYHKRIHITAPLPQVINDVDVV